MGWNDRRDFSILVGKTLTQCFQVDDEEIHFITDEASYKLLHNQDCCEHVYVEDVCGDLNDLVGTPILFAEEASSSDETVKYGSGTWTFYKIATIKGSVTIRFHGESNGYYSESVDFEEYETSTIH
jgi:hypothetical protein